MADDGSIGLKEVAVGAGVVVAFFLFLTVLIVGWYQFKLWRVAYVGKALEIEREYKGKAILAEAQHSRQARVEGAKAEKEAAQLTADAIAIVGQAAKDFPEYRQQEFYLALGDALKEGKIQQIIYLPTEGGMPITEAGRGIR